MPTHSQHTSTTPKTYAIKHHSHNMSHNTDLYKAILIIQKQLLEVTNENVNRITIYHIIHLLGEYIIAELKEGNSFNLYNFGTWKVNPVGDNSRPYYKAEARFLPKFKPGKTMLNAVRSIDILTADTTNFDLSLYSKRRLVNIKNKAEEAKTKPASPTQPKLNYF